MFMISILESFYEPQSQTAHSISGCYGGNTGEGMQSVHIVRAHDVLIRQQAVGISSVSLTPRNVIR